LILASADNEVEVVSYLTLLWIEQRINKCANQSEVRQQLDSIIYECEAEQLIQEMEVNRLIPGLHYTAHKLDEMREYSRYLNDKDDKTSGRN
jgi:hypothetical protein